CLFDEYVVTDLRLTDWVPPEQAQRLQALVSSRFIDYQGRCLLPDVPPEQWAEVVEKLGLAPNGGPWQHLSEAIAAGPGRLLLALRKIELRLAGSPLADTISTALQQIYEQALLEPRFSSQNLIWIGLQRPGPDGEEKKDILSESEAIS